MFGKVYIIGVGPGDHKLITLKAVECIKKADVIVYDRLVNNKILRYKKADAELIFAGKRPGFHTMPQEEINKILIAKAKEGKTVARVKGGDPFLFGRGGEEALSLYEDGVVFEIIPGVTSALSVPAYSGIPVTHRGISSSIHIITGHENPQKEISSIDFKSLATVTGTIVFLMGIKNIYDICNSLIKHGKDKDTPVAVIENGTTFEQRLITSTLEDIHIRLEEEKITSPAVIVIGEVVNLSEKLKWFRRGPLNGAKVLVTRAREQAGMLVEKIEELGGEAIEFPAIRIEEVQDNEEINNVLNSLKSYTWLVFTSVNGIEMFFNKIKTRGMDIRELAGVKIAAIGASTKQKLNEKGLNVDFTPAQYTTKDLLQGLLSKVKENEKIILARSNIADPSLYEGLLNQGLDVCDLVLYNTLEDEENKEYVIELMGKGKIDYITFTSSSCVNNFVSIIGKENINLANNSKIICIGPITEQTAKKNSLKVSRVADVYTIDGIIEKLLEIG